MTWYYKLLELSKNSGCTEAYDAVTDCYAKLYDLEAAEKVTPFDGVMLQYIYVLVDLSRIIY